MNDESICDECGTTTDDYESCEICGITICGDCAVQDEVDGKVVWRCESCDEECRENLPKGAGS